MSKLHTVLTGLLVSAALAVPAIANAAGYYDYQYYQPNTYNNTYDTQYDYDRYPASYQQQFQHLYGDTYGNYCGFYDGYYRCPTDSDYQRSYQYNSPVYRPVTSSYEALPDYYQDYLTPPPASTTYIRGVRSVPAPKYYPPSREVTIYGDNFHATNITVKRGTMVTWISLEKGSHALKGDNFDFVSVAFDENSEASYSFNKTGKFYYHCILHPHERGMVTVTD